MGWRTYRGMSVAYNVLRGQLAVRYDGGVAKMPITKDMAMCVALGDMVLLDKLLDVLLGGI